MEGCELVGDGAVSEAARACIHLRELNAARCRRLTDGGLRALLPLAAHHVLVDVNVSQCAAVTRPAVELLAATGCQVVSSNGSAWS